MVFNSLASSSPLKVRWGDVDQEEQGFSKCRDDTSSGDLIYGIVDIVNNPILILESC